MYIFPPSQSVVFTAGNTDPGVGPASGAPNPTDEQVISSDLPPAETEIPSEAQKEGSDEVRICITDYTFFDVSMYRKMSVALGRLKPCPQTFSPL